MPTRTYTVVLERADTLKREYVARVPSLDQTSEYISARGRTPAEAVRRVKEAIVTCLTRESHEPDFKDYPLDRPKPRLLKVQVALPKLVNFRDLIQPQPPAHDNVIPFKPRNRA